MSATTEEVPFVTIGNRLALTDYQLATQPHLVDFLKRFSGSFERDEVHCAWLFISDFPPGTPQKRIVSDS